MPYDTLKNLAYGTVLIAPAPPNAGTSLTLATGHGGRFGAAPFSVSIWPFGVPADPTNTEIVRVISKAGDVFTIQRQQEGSQPRTILTGDQVAQAMTARFITDLTNTLLAYTDNKDLNMKTYVDNLDAAQRTYIDTRDNQVNSLALQRYPRTWNIPSAATPVITNIDLYDQVFIYQQPTGMPLTIANPTGSVSEGMGLLIRIRDQGGSPPSISWGNAFIPGGSVPLPTATVAWKTMSMAFRYNGLYQQWMMLAYVVEA